MSGPKLSQAELERLRQEQLEQERQEALRRLRDAQNAYQNACSKVQSVKDYAYSALSGVHDSMRVKASDDLKAVLAQLSIPTVKDDKNPAAYHTAADALNASADTVLKQVDQIMAKYTGRSQTIQQLGNASDIHRSFQAFVASKQDPVDVKKVDFRSNYDQTQLQTLFTNILNHYQWMKVYGKTAADKAFADRSLQALAKWCADPHFLSKAKETKDFLQRIINDEAELQRVQAEKDALYADYTAIATMLNVTPDPKSSFRDTNVLRARLQELNALYRKKDEMDYIADQINDVMIALGYSFVTSSVLTRKDSSEMDFSLYRADDETGIAIYTDQSGAVMMRMTVLGDDDAITDADRDFSYQRQIDFCSGHPDIVQALAERGVYLKQTNYQEPSKKHTYKISTKTVQVSAQTNGQKDKVDRRKRRRASTKKVRTM